MTFALSIHDRLVPLLGTLCAVLAISYVSLMVTTIFFASWQSQAMNTIRTNESRIGNLESQYYSTINNVSSIDPSSLGFVAPTDVEYVAAANTPSNLTFAGK